MHLLLNMVVQTSADGAWSCSLSSSWGLRKAPGVLTPAWTPSSKKFAKQNFYKNWAQMIVLEMTGRKTKTSFGTDYYDWLYISSSYRVSVDRRSMVTRTLSITPPLASRVTLLRHVTATGMSNCGTYAPARPWLPLTSALIRLTESHLMDPRPCWP